MTDGYTTQLVGAAQDLGEGRFGVLVEHDGATFYVEHRVTTEGLRAAVWDETGDDLVVERSMDWAEVIQRMFSTWQDGATSASE